GLDGVLDGGRAAAVEAVVGAVLEMGSAAGGGSAVRRVGAARDHHLIDRAVVVGVGGQVLRHLGLHLGVGDVGRRGGGVEHIGGAGGQVGCGDELVAAAQVLVVLGDDVVLAGRAVLVAERDQRLRVGVVGRRGVLEARPPEDQDHLGGEDDRTAVVGRV